MSFGRGSWVLLEIEGYTDQFSSNVPLSINYNLERQIFPSYYLWFTYSNKKKIIRQGLREMFGSAVQFIPHKV